MQTAPRANTDFFSHEGGAASRFNPQQQCRNTLTPPEMLRSPTLPRLTGSRTVASGEENITQNGWLYQRISPDGIQYFLCPDAVASPLFSSVYLGYSLLPRRRLSDSSQSSEGGTSLETPSISEVGAILQEAREVFGLSIADLARLVGVSRPTVYSYLQCRDVIPHEETREKIQALCAYAAKTREATSGRGVAMRHLVKRRIFKGKSLFDIMQQNENIDIPLQTLLQLHQAEKRMGRELVARLKGKPILNTEDDVSMPSSRE